MARYIKMLTWLTIMFAVTSVTEAYPTLPSLEPIDRCIYSCAYCFKDNFGVVCANECLVTDGKMHSFWLKICPQLGIPHFYLKALEFDEMDTNSAINDNKLH